MKIALAPDLHCYYNTYDKLDKTGESKRKKEWKNATAEFYRVCKKQKVDVAVFPGDFFVNPKPTAECVLLISKLFREMEKIGVKVIGITGNHDITGSNRKSMNDVVSAIGDNEEWCYSKFDTLVIDDVGFGFLPFVKAPEITAYNPDYAQMEMSEQLIQIAGGLSAKMSEDTNIKKKILVGHWSIQGAITSSGKTMERTINGVEVVLPLGELATQGWDAILFGHIHKPQVLHEQKPFVAYSGCIQRINIGEANDKRGFYIYDTSDDSYVFHEFSAIEMKSFHAVISTPDDVDALLKEISESDIKDKIVQVKYDISKDNVDLVNQKLLIKALEKKKPMNVVNILPRILEASRQRDITLTESLDSETALKKWMSNKGIIDKEQDKIMVLFNKYKERILEEAK